MNEKIYEAILNPVTVACLFVGGSLIGVGLARIGVDLVSLIREVE